jgi:hypothetical protein
VLGALETEKSIMFPGCCLVGDEDTDVKMLKNPDTVKDLDGFDAALICVERMVWQPEQIALPPVRQDAVQVNGRNDVLDARNLQFEPQ